MFLHQYLSTQRVENKEHFLLNSTAPPADSKSKELCVFSFIRIQMKMNRALLL